MPSGSPFSNQSLAVRARTNYSTTCVRQVWARAVKEKGAPLGSDRCTMKQEQLKHKRTENLWCNPGEKPLGKNLQEEESVALSQRGGDIESSGRTV